MKAGATKHLIVKKALISIQNNDLRDLASFQVGLQSVFPIINVQRANWIKPRKPTTFPILVNFAVEELPEYLRITGEFVLTRVYPYNDKPMQCRNCQMYRHTTKRCSREHPTCGRCAGQHNTAECGEEAVICANFKAQHSASSQLSKVGRRRWRSWKRSRGIR